MRNIEIWYFKVYVFFNLKVDSWVSVTTISGKFEFLYIRLAFTPWKFITRVIKSQWNAARVFHTYQVYFFVCLFFFLLLLKPKPHYSWACFLHSLHYSCMCTTPTNLPKQQKWAFFRVTFLYPFLVFFFRSFQCSLVCWRVVHTFTVTIAHWSTRTLLFNVIANESLIEGNWQHANLKS